MGGAQRFFVSLLLRLILHNCLSLLRKTGVKRLRNDRKTKENAPFLKKNPKKFGRVKKT